MSPLMISRLRLISGFILFAFILGHFINHMLGIFSLAAMNNALKYSILPWRTTLGATLIFAALTVHVALAVWALYVKRSLRLKRWEIIQLVSGFAIPLLMAGHVLSSRGAYESLGIEIDYSFQLYVQWVGAPSKGILAFAGLIFVWVHSCIGWHFWLRYYRWYHGAKPYLYAAALLVPTLAIAGAVSGGFRVLRLSRSEKWVDRVQGQLKGQDDRFLEYIATNETIVFSSVLATLAIVFSIHGARWLAKRTASGATLEYRDIKTGERTAIKFAPGQTLLEHLKEKRIPHASVCGGRGRCSTCRVRIDAGIDNLLPAEPAEKRILNQVGAQDNVRLACQIRPKSDVSVTALMRPDVGAREAFSKTRSKSGEEQNIAILFADIRAFTKLSETQLPFDTAFLLNRYFAAMGTAIEEAGGHLDKFIGDGVMALFGVDENLQTGCKKALIAAAKMSERLEELNKQLANELDEPLRIGIGIHSGTAIIGNMGYKHASGLTAIGDVVNTASRLESMTKEFGAQLIVSQNTVLESGIEPQNAKLENVSVRGREEPLPIYVFESATQIVQSKEAVA